jgi:hypothetical protein
MVDEKVSKVLQEIRKDKAMEDYFFTKLGSTDDPFKWLAILKENNYFDPSHNPPPKPVDEDKKMFVTPYWNVLGYLENLSKKLKNKPDEKITKQLIEIVNAIIDSRVDNFRTDWMLVKTIFNLPIEYITEKHMNFLKTALLTNATLVSAELLNSVVPYFLESNDKEKTLQFLKVLLDYKKEESPIGKNFVSILENYWLQEILTKFENHIFKKCGIESASVAAAKIEEILSQDKSRFSVASIVTVENSPQNLSHNTYERLCVSFLRDSLLSSGAENSQGKTKEFFNKKESILVRIAIYVINLNYETHKNIFWDSDKNPVDNLDLTHELYDLFENHAQSFSKDEIKKIIGWIETQESLKKYPGGQPENVKSRAYRKKYWLMPLLKSNNKSVQALFQKYNDENPGEISHPGYLVWFSGGATEVPSRQPLEIAIEEKTNEEISEYLKEHNEMAENFQISVRRNTKQFSSDMKPFRKLPLQMQASLVSGLADAWKTGEGFELKEFLDFLTYLTAEESFWKDPNAGSRDWLIRNAAELIENGCKDEKHTFDASLLPSCEKILIDFLKKDSSKLGTFNDLLTEVLNSPKEAILSAIVSYSVKIHRLNKQLHLSENVKAALAPFITTPKDIAVFLTLGYKLTTLYFIDKDWVATNVNRIFPQNNDDFFKPAIVGYLSGSSMIYQEIYQLLKSSGIYQKAIKLDFEDKSTAEMLSGHVIVGYLNFEKLEDEDSLIGIAIERADARQLLAIAQFFSPSGANLPESQKIKIVPLWKKLIDVIIPKAGKPEFQEVLVSLNNWINLLDKLDNQAAEILYKLVKFLKYDYQAKFLLDGLQRFVDTQPKLVGNVLLELTSSGLYVAYKNKEMISLVKSIYEKGEKNTGNQVCNLYREKGLFYLEELYDTFNKK